MDQQYRTNLSRFEMTKVLVRVLTAEQACMLSDEALRERYEAHCAMCRHLSLRLASQPPR